MPFTKTYCLNFHWLHGIDRLYYKYYAMPLYHRQASNIIRTLVINEIFDNSDVVGASSVGAAPTISSFST